MDEVKPAACVPTVEHREPCESRGSRTVLGAPGGEIPPGDSTFASYPSAAELRRMSAMPSTATDSVRRNEPTRKGHERRYAMQQNLLIRSPRPQSSGTRG